MTITADRLKSLIERVERIESDITDLNADKREVYAEAKSDGFDTAIMRQVIKLRKMDSHDRQEQEELIDTYMAALSGQALERVA